MSATFPVNVLLIKYTDTLLLERGRGSIQTFAQDLREAYERTVPAPHRDVKWSDSPVASKRMEADEKHVLRFLGRAQPTQRIPTELFGPWLTLLPREAADEVLTAFLQPFDATLMRVKRASGSEIADLVSLAQLMSATSQAVEAIAPMLENGVFGPEDRPLARKALMLLADLGGAVSELQKRIASILPEAPA